MVIITQNVKQKNQAFCVPVTQCRWLVDVYSDNSPYNFNTFVRELYEKHILWWHYTLKGSKTNKLI